MDRRLAAILSADIEGYSRLIRHDEEHTVREVQAHLAAAMGKISECGGRLINTMGDGFLAEFSSVVGAVRCAVAIQEIVNRRNDGLPADRRALLRIGINQGEVVSDGGDVFGDGINVAARIQALASPGGIAISGRVHEDLTGKLDLVWRDTGDHELKNIARPVRVWQWPQGEMPEQPSPPLPDRPSVAVLPFDNLSGQPDATLFSDGVSEDIITGLAQFHSLFVVARNSSFRFRGASVSPADIGRQLGVAYLLEGSVRRAGNRIRIAAQLIEAATGAHVWADRYDRSLDDVFAVQDEVATMIVSTLFGRIEAAKFQQSLRKPPESLQAYDFLLRGRDRFRNYDDSSNQEACALLQKAIGCDPRYALAHTYLALTTLALHGYALAPPDVLKAATARAAHGVELAPQEGSCHRILGLILLFAQDYDASEYHTRRAVELNPNDADAVSALGNVLASRGDAEGGIVWIDKAMRLNPFHLPVYHHHRGIALYLLRRFDEAAKAFERISQPWLWSRVRKVACYGQLGRAEEAIAAVDDILRERPSFTIADYLRRGALLERPEDIELLREGLRKAGLPE